MALDYDMPPRRTTPPTSSIPDELTAFAVYSKGGAQAVWTSYKNDEVDKLVEDAERELDPDKRQEMYNKIQSIHLDDAPFIFLYYPSGRTATHGARQELPHPADRQLPPPGSLAGRRLSDGR